MEATRENLPGNAKLAIANIRTFISQVPLLCWLLGILVAIALEHLVQDDIVGVTDDGKYYLKDKNV